MPDAPDPYTEYLQGYQAQIETYPQQRAIDYAARTGGKVTVDGVTYDFTGQGDAAYQSEYARKMAATMLQLQQQYGKDYVDQYLKELELADPQGVAMRKKLWQDIQSDLSRTDERRALAEQTQASILAELEKGATLDPQMEREVLQATKGRQAASGIVYGAAANRQQAVDLLTAGNQVKAERQQRALAFLTSGKTPEDIEYQNRQQAMSNLGAFISGETPVAQFGQLKGASNGIVPNYNSGPGVGMNQNAGTQSLSYANQIWGSNVNLAAQQANPYLAGLGLGFNAMSLYNLWGGSGASASSVPANTLSLQQNSIYTG